MNDSYAINWNHPLDMNALIITGWIGTAPTIRETLDAYNEEHRYLSFLLRYRESLTGPHVKRKEITGNLPVICRSRGVLKWAEKSLEKGHRIAINGRLGIRMIKNEDGEPVFLPPYYQKAVSPFIEAWSITILHLSYEKPDTMPTTHPRFNPGGTDAELNALIKQEARDDEEEIW